MVADERFEFVLPQRIGVYYLDQEWKKEMFLKLTNYYNDRNLIKSIHYLKNGSKIRLTDGSEIDFAQANEQSRGRRYSKIIMQQGISQEFINCVIEPSLIPPNRMCMVF